MLEKFFLKLQSGNITEEKMEKLFQDVSEQVDWKNDEHEIHELTHIEFMSILKFYKKKMHGQDDLFIDLS